MVSRSPLPALHRFSARRLFVFALGLDGYCRVRTTARRVLQWVAYVALLEACAFVTLRILAWSDAQYTLSGQVAVAIHSGIAVLAMIGFFVAELMDQIQYAAQRLARIRSCWNHSNRPRPSDRDSVDQTVTGAIDAPDSAQKLKPVKTQQDLRQ